MKEKIDKIYEVYMKYYKKNKKEKDRVTKCDLIQKNRRKRNTIGRISVEKTKTEKRKNE